MLGVFKSHAVIPTPSLSVGPLLSRGGWGAVVFNPGTPP